MRAAIILAFLLATAVRSDVARQYAPGTEPAKGGQDLSKQYAPGKELAHNGNQHLAHNYGDTAK